MKIEVNISKKYFFGILFAIALLGAGVLVYAFGTSTPAVFGHSADEITGVCKTDGTGCPPGMGGGSCLSAGMFECYNSLNSYNPVTGKYSELYEIKYFTDKSVYSSQIVDSTCRLGIDDLFLSRCYCKYVETVCLTSNVCGNGVVESGEVCDDGNTFNDDFCFTDCTLNSRLQGAILLREGTTFTDGYVLPQGVRALSTYDDFSGDKGGVDNVCQQVQPGSTRAVDYEMSNRADDHSLAAPGYGAAQRHNGAWTIVTMPRADGYYIWVKCE